MAYITKDEVKKYMGVNFTSGMDSFVDMVIAGCQKYIEKVCGSPRFGDRVFEAPDPDTSSTRRFNGSGDTKLYVGDLFEVDSVTIDNYEYVIDEDVFAYPLNNVDEAYHWLEIAQPETRLNANSRVGNSDPYIFEAAQANVEIEGKWYFSETAPANIKLAHLKLVGGVLKENVADADVKEKKSETLGDYRVDFQDLDKLAHTLKVDDLLSPFMMSKDKTGMSGGIGASAGVIKVS